MPYLLALHHPADRLLTQRTDVLKAVSVLYRYLDLDLLRLFLCLFNRQVHVDFLELTDFLLHLRDQRLVDPGAVQQDSQNPVYYVQYAHARICSILRALEAEGVTPRDCTAEELALLTAPEELELIQHIASYTDEIIGAAKDYDPVRITRYVIELATKFHKFYNACRVKGEEESLMQARLTLCRATATVIRNVLTMFNITVPTSM